MLLLFIIYLTMLFSMTRANIPTSVHQLENLIETQARIIDALEKFLSKQNKRINGMETIKQYLKRTKQEHKMAVRDIDHYLGNPINAYTLIKRQSMELLYVESLIGNSSVYRRDVSVRYPTKEDLNAAVACFLQLQMVYRLNAKQLANGTLSGYYSRNRKPFMEHVTPLSTSDCYELGRSNYSDKDYNRNIAWLMEAHHKYNKKEYDVSNVTNFDIMYNLVHMYTLMVDVDKAGFWMNELLNVILRDPDFDLEDKHSDMLKDVLDLSEYIQQTDKTRIFHKKFPSFQVNNEEISKSCRGEIKVFHNNNRPLACVYAHWPHPFLILARIRTEILSFEPPVALYHDVISDTEIQRLQILASTKNAAVTTSASFIHNSTQLLPKISRRIEQFTGLSVESANSQHAINYGLGGHYEKYHHFSLNPDEQSINASNRIATVLLYLSEVEQGGATIFVNLPLTVFPVKGAALFWMNMLPNGERDKRSFHASCPVMRGDKWVLTNWLFETGQELRRPCSVDKTTFTYGR